MSDDLEWAERAVKAMLRKLLINIAAEYRRRIDELEAAR